MNIINLSENNILHLDVDIDDYSSLGIGGLSGSGKSIFCQVLSDESVHRIITLLPKSEYRFLFSDQLSTNHSAHHIKNIP